MKKSKRYLTILLAVPFVIVLFVLIYVRVSVGNASEYEVYSSKNHIKLDNDVVLKNFDFSDFDRIKLQGNWKVEVKSGPEYLVTVSGPEYIINSGNINQTDDQINLLERFPSRTDNDKLEALIIMPVLEQFTARGEGRMYIENFNCRELEIKFDGAGRLTVINSTIDDLQLTGRGQINFDLEESKVTNADLSLYGSIETDITMNGGQLTGRATGDVEVDYFGTVSKQNVKTSGGSSVNKRE